MHPALHPAKPLACIARPSRPYVSTTLLRTFDQIPALGAARQAFGFQAIGECVPNTAGMLHRTVDKLKERGALQRNPSSLLGRAVRALNVPGGYQLSLLGRARDAAALQSKNTAAGPLLLVGPGFLQPGQGDKVYEPFHAALLVASLRHGGRDIGILLDGNDLQDNPVTHALRAWHARRPDTRTIDQLTAADFETFNRAHPDLDLYQCAFRVVDLADMLAASERPASGPRFTGTSQHNPFVPLSFEAGTTVMGLPETEAVMPLIGPEHAQAVSAALAAEASAIERFPARPADWRARR